VLWLSPWPRSADKPSVARPAPLAGATVEQLPPDVAPGEAPQQLEPASDPLPTISAAAPAHAGHDTSASHAVRTGRGSARLGGAPRSSAGDMGISHGAHGDTSGSAAERSASTERSSASQGSPGKELEQPAAEELAPKQAAEEPAAEKQVEAPPPKGEVDLLFQARQLRRSAPRKALALLDEHAARFADGMLAPEREVIAIEILRALGQDEEAAQRLARYRTRYPQSLHLPGLENKR
jgi:hypothetical protein